MIFRLLFSKSSLVLDKNLGLVGLKRDSIAKSSILLPQL